MIKIEINKENISSTVEGSPIEIITELIGVVITTINHISNEGVMDKELATQLFEDSFHFAIGR